MTRPVADEALVFIADEAMRYVSVNERACEVLGYSRDELLELRVTDVAVAPEAADLYRDMLEERSQLGTTLLRTKHGEELPFHYFAQEATASPYFVSAGFVGEGRWTDLEPGRRRAGERSLEDLEEDRSNLLADVNDRIEEVAAALRDRVTTHWEFLCECGRASCTGRVLLALAELQRLRRIGEPVVAPGHGIALARHARRVAAEVAEREPPSVR